VIDSEAVRSFVEIQPRPFERDRILDCQTGPTHQQNERPNTISPMLIIVPSQPVTVTVRGVKQTLKFLLGEIVDGRRFDLDSLFYCTRGTSLNHYRF
jgi:hypothetical protein